MEEPRETSKTEEPPATSLPTPAPARTSPNVSTMTDVARSVVPSRTIPTVRAFRRPAAPARRMGIAPRRFVPTSRSTTGTARRDAHKIRTAGARPNRPTVGFKTPVRTKGPVFDLAPPIRTVPARITSVATRTSIRPTSVGPSVPARRVSGASARSSKTAAAERMPRVSPAITTTLATAPRSDAPRARARAAVTARLPTTPASRTTASNRAVSIPTAGAADTPATTGTTTGRTSVTRPVPARVRWAIRAAVSPTAETATSPSAWTLRAGTAAWPAALAKPPARPARPVFRTFVWRTVGAMRTAPAPDTPARAGIAFRSERPRRAGRVW